MEPGYFIGMIILVVVCWYIGEPLFLGVRKGAVLTGAASKAIRDLELRKEEVMLTLKDLEMDFRMQKISEQDYQLLYAEAVQQGSRLVQQIDTAKNSQTKLDANESSVRPAQKFCTQCGTALVAGTKFCGACGHKI